MKQSRGNALLGLAAAAVGGLLLAQSLGLLTSGLNDLILRALPGLLIALGLGWALRGRVPFSGVIAVALAAVIVVNVAIVAFSTRSGQSRDDQQIEIAQPIEPAVTLLTVELNLLATDLILESGTDRAVQGEFVGSTESNLNVQYVEDPSGRATLSITETQPNSIQRLDAVGRGRVTLSLPPETGLDVTVTLAQGAATLNLDLLDLERLNLDLLRGDSVITLPDYAPRSPSLVNDPNAINGTLTVRDGAITIAVPRTVAARFELNRGGGSQQPQFDDTAYNYLVGDVLENRRFDDSEIRLRYAVIAPRGLIRITDSAR